MGNQHSKESVEHVMRLTGCTEQQAKDELTAEEGNVADAVLNLRAALAEPQA